MDAWAESFGSAAAFVCVCCAGPQLATQFGTQLKLKHCHNTWVDEDDMPTVRCVISDCGRLPARETNT